MSERLPSESDEAYFRRMVKKHKPVPDRAPEPVTVMKATWEDDFWKLLATAEDGTTSSTSEEGTTSSTSEEGTTSSPAEKATGARPKTSRRNSSRVTTPTDEDLRLAALLEDDSPPRWVRRRFPEFDPKIFDIRKSSCGKFIISRKNHMAPGYLSEDGSLRLSEKYFLYLKLQEMDLNDPQTIEKIRLACSSGYKCGDKSCVCQNK